MNYSDIVGGTWYPKGGMISVVRAMHQLAKELGVKFDLETDVTKINVENNKATSVTGTKNYTDFDAVVSSADYHFTEQKLLDENYRNYSANYWESRKLAPSSLIFYIGVGKKLPNLLHHTLFFDEDFALHSEEIYTTPKWPTKPLLYLSCTSQSDKSVAPEGCENLMVLIPIAPNLKDDKKTNDYYFDLVINRIENTLALVLKMILFIVEIMLLLIL